MNDSAMKDVVTEGYKDLSPKWTELCERVREISTMVKHDTAGTTAGIHAAELDGEVNRLCQHIEKIHLGVEDLIRVLEANQREQSLGNSKEHPSLDPHHAVDDLEEFQRAAIRVQKE